MQRAFAIAAILLIAAPAAHSQSDEELLAVVRASAIEIYLEQASWVLPETFHDSGLAPSDKARLTEQWAEASAECLVDALAKYAETAAVPLSEMVNDDGSFGLWGAGSTADFEVSLAACIEQAWAAVGAAPP